MRLKSFIVVSVIAGAGLVGYGVAALLDPRILFDAFSSHVYAFPAAAIRAIAYQSGLYRLLGYLNLLLGSAALALLAHWRSQRDPWSLRFLIVLLAFAYAGPVVFDTTVGVIGPAEIVEIVVLVAVLATGALAWAPAAQQANRADGRKVD